MIKSSIITIVALYLVLTVSAPAIPNDCICSSAATISLLDFQCKVSCGEMFGTGECYGWELVYGRCAPSGSRCETKWKLYCSELDPDPVYASDYCFQCPFYEDPGSGGGNN